MHKLLLSLLLVSGIACAADLNEINRRVKQGQMPAYPTAKPGADYSEQGYIGSDKLAKGTALPKAPTEAELIASLKGKTVRIINADAGLIIMTPELEALAKRNGLAPIDMFKYLADNQKHLTPTQIANGEGSKQAIADSTKAIVAAFSATIDSLSKELASNKETIRALNETIASLQLTAEGYRLELNKTNATLALRDATIASMTEQVVALVKSNDDVRKALEAEVSNGKLLVIARDQALVDLGKANAAKVQAEQLNAELQVELSNAKAERDVAQASLATANATVATLTTDLAAVTSDRDAKAAEVVTLTAQVATLNSSLASMTALRDAYKSNLNIANTNYSNLSAAYSNTQTELKAKTDTLTIRTSERDIAQAQVTSLTADLAIANTLAASLQAQVDTANTTISTLTFERNSATALYNDALTAYNETKAELDKWANMLPWDAAMMETSKKSASDFGDKTPDLGKWYTDVFNSDWSLSSSTINTKLSTAVCNGEASCNVGSKIYELVLKADAIKASLSQIDPTYAGGAQLYFVAGWWIGYNQGWDEGYKVGYVNGYADGYKAGHRDGYNLAKSGATR